jgi:Spy/CpxP family protein refolding chaperone
MKLKLILFVLLSFTLALSQGRRGGGQMTWDESLNLTTEQMQQITELREAMQPAMQTMRQNTRTLEQELRQLTRSGDGDADRIAELEASIATNEAAMAALMEGHRTQIRNLLTPDQQLIFDQHEFGPRDDRGRGRDDQRGNRPGNTGNRGNRGGRGRW